MLCRLDAGAVWIVWIVGFCAVASGRRRIGAAGAWIVKSFNIYGVRSTHSVVKDYIQNTSISSQGLDINMYTAGRNSLALFFPFGVIRWTVRSKCILFSFLFLLHFHFHFHFHLHLALFPPAFPHFSLMKCERIGIFLIPQNLHSLHFPGLGQPT
jgi:hypothetical protein